MKLNPFGKEAWTTFEYTVETFLLNAKVQNYRDLVFDSNNKLKIAKLGIFMLILT